MKKSQLKQLIRKIIKEAVANEIFGWADWGHSKRPEQTEQQKWVVDVLKKRGFRFEAVEESPKTKEPVVKLSRPYGKGKHGGPRFAYVYADGSINHNLNVDKFLSVVGEEMSKVQKPEFKKGVTVPFAAVNVGEGMHDSRPCDCGSGQDSEWQFDGQGIPLVRACAKCKQKKLSKYRPEILKRYTQADVDEPIEPEDDRYEEDVSEQTGTGAVGGYSTPFAFSKKGGTSRAIKAAKKYGKVVKSISERVKK